MEDNLQDGAQGAKAEGAAQEKEGIWSNLKSAGVHLFQAAMDLQEVQTDVVTAVPKAIYKENETEINAAAGGIVDLASAGADFQAGVVERSVYNLKNKPVTTVAENIMLPGFSIVHAYVAEGFDRLTK